MNTGKWAFLLGVFPMMGCLSGSGRAVGGSTRLPNSGGPPTKWAFIVGVNNYGPRSGVRNLEFCVNDAEELAAVLIGTGDYKNENVIVLTGRNEERANTRNNVLTMLERVVALPGPEDTMLFYFGGHGVDQRDAGQMTLYLLPSDGAQDSAALTGIPLSQVKERLNACKAFQKIIILDSCYSGINKGDDDKMSEATARTIKGISEALRRRSGTSVVTLSACDWDQSAREWPETRHGIFSYFLIQGLKGAADADGNRNVTASELADYVQPNVIRMAWLNGGWRQTPIVEIRSSTPIVVAALSGKPGDWDARLEELKRKAEERKRERISAATKAFEDAKRIELMAAITPKEKATTWQAYLDNFDDVGHELAYARERAAYWGARIVVVPDWAKVSKEQIAYAEKSGLPVAKEVSLGAGLAMRFVLIPPGEFMMGSKLSPEEVDKRWPGGQLDWYKDEHPRHKVQITKPFYMAVEEVTRGQFDRFVRSESYKTDAEKAGKAWAFKDGKFGEHDGVTWRDPLFKQTDDHPVICVSWNDATAFCKWLFGQSAVDARLPTEAEWEYACRAGSDGTWWWGDKEEDAQGRANVSDEQYWTRPFKGVRDGHPYTAPVGSFAGNEFGLKDMIGNVWEWCSDWFDASYYEDSPKEDPVGPATGRFRVVRGGSWLDDPRHSRSSCRLRGSPSYASSDYGCRVVLSARAL